MLFEALIGMAIGLGPTIMFIILNRKNKQHSREHGK